MAHTYSSHASNDFVHMSLGHITCGLLSDITVSCGWRTFMMICLRWILGYMRREIWCKISLSGDWCLCTALRTRSGVCYCWEHCQSQLNIWLCTRMWWRTFMMTCLRWILGYMRREIWHKIGLSADWCLCTVLRTRSGACYHWIVLKRLNQSRWHKKVGLGSAQKSMY